MLRYSTAHPYAVGRPTSHVELGPDLGRVDRRILGEVAGKRVVDKHNATQLLEATLPCRPDRPDRHVQRGRHFLVTRRGGRHQHAKQPLTALTD